MVLGAAGAAWPEEGGAGLEGGLGGVRAGLCLDLGVGVEASLRRYLGPEGKLDSGGAGCGGRPGPG